MAEKPENPSKPANDFLGWTLDDTDYDFSIPVNRDTKLLASWRTYKPLDFHPFSLQCSIEEKTDYGISYKDITKMKLNQNFVCMVWFSAEEYNYKGYDRVKNYNYNLEFGDGLKLLSKKGVTKTDGQKQIIDIKSHDSNVLVGKEYYYFKMQSTDKSKLYVRVKDIKVTTATDNYYSVGDKANAEIIDIRVQEWRLKLSIRKPLIREERKSFEKYLDEEEVSFNIGEAFKDVLK